MSVDKAAMRAEWEELSEEEQVARAPEFAAHLLNGDVIIGGATMVSTILGLFDEGLSREEILTHLLLMQGEFESMGVSFGEAV